jgi:hypothetical protein
MTGFVRTWAELVWRPLVEPSSHYPWSVLWRADDHSEHVRAVAVSAQRLSQDFSWLEPTRAQATS